MIILPNKMNTGRMFIALPIANGFNQTRCVVSNKVITMGRATVLVAAQGHHQNHFHVTHT
jgi:hypothetical protein